jgi:hypothetical protein
MNSFKIDNPCFHWFTYPQGIKKKYFSNYLNTPIGFYRLESYFRWLANSEKHICNISDLKSEQSSNAFMETTYKYKNIEWSISIKETDIVGHSSSQYGKDPHFHLQMLVDNNIFIKFSDFHIPFSDEDLFTIESLKQAPDKVIQRHSFGEGISILEDEENIDLLDESMEITDEENGAINRSTIITAPEGKKISGDVIEKAIKESNATKQPVGRVLQKLLPDYKSTVIFSPGEAVIDLKKRGGK